MTAIQIQGVSAEDFIARLRNELVECVSVHTPTSSEQDMLMDTLIDRNFIKRNLSIGDKKIISYERNGTLRRAFNDADTKSVFYRLADFVKVYNAEVAKLHRKEVNR